MRAFNYESLPAAPAAFGSYIFINFRLEKPRKQPISTKILRRWRMAMDDFGRVLVKLRVPARDVRADGGIV